MIFAFMNFEISVIMCYLLYVASAEDDIWADPRGEYLSIAEASRVYSLYGYGTLPADKVPEVDTPVVAGRTGYHVRTGGHDVTAYDWKCFIDFADRYLK